MSYNLYTVNIEDAVNEMRKSIDKKECAAFFVESDKKFAYVPEWWYDTQVNTQETIELFSQYGITPYNMFYATPVGNGVIIGSPGDLSFLVMRPYDEKRSIFGEFEPKLLSYMQSKFTNSVLDENDILIDGKKSIGSVGNVVNGMSLYMFMASFVDNTDLIGILCPPGHTKIPKPIDNSVLTKDEFKNEISTWLV